MIRLHRFTQIDTTGPHGTYKMRNGTKMLNKPSLCLLTAANRRLVGRQSILDTYSRFEKAIDRSRTRSILYMWGSGLGSCTEDNEEQLFINWE